MEQTVAYKRPVDGEIQTMVVKDGCRATSELNQVWKNQRTFEKKVA